jgi:hypothetical protein
VADYEREKRVASDRAREERAMSSAIAKAVSTVGHDHQFVPAKEDE